MYYQKSVFLFYFSRFKCVCHVQHRMLDSYEIATNFDWQKQLAPFSCETALSISCVSGVMRILSWNINGLATVLHYHPWNESKSYEVTSRRLMDMVNTMTHLLVLGHAECT